MKQLFSLLFAATLVVQAQYFTKVTVGPQSNDGGDSRSVNWVDYNNDGNLDLFITNGPSAKANNFLYKNNGDGTFTKIIDASVVNDPGSYDGSTWADFDNNGFLDVFTASWYGQKNSFHRQLNGHFEKVTRSDIANDQTYSETGSWGDYDNDGYVDLYLANSAVNKANRLYKNNGDGTFTTITTGSIVTDAKTSRSVDWFDYDNDGDLDIFVANEGGENNSLYRNDGGGIFTSITTGAVVNDGGNSFGSSVGDIDNDGDLDIFVANHENTAAFLYKNNGDGTFAKVSADPVVTQNGYSVGSAFGDLDNDGDLDLMVTNAFSGSVAAKNFLYLNNGNGTFENVDTGIVANDPGWSYGVAFGDYDRDGDLDIATGNCFGANQNNSLYRNEGNGNAWITVKSVGTVSNRSAIGAKVRVKATINGIPVWQYRQVAGQSGYCGQNLESHFGLGNATAVDSLVVEFPSGQKTVMTTVSVKQVLTVTETVPSGYLRGALIADSLDGRIPFTVQFSSLSIADASSPVNSWKWDFHNDGIVDATTEHAQWTYTVPDTYSVRLIVSNGSAIDTVFADGLIRVLRPASKPVITSFLPTVADTTIPKNGKVTFAVFVLDTSDSPVRFVWTKNRAVQASVINSLSYVSAIFQPAPRTDTISVEVFNDFYSIKNIWFVHVANPAGIGSEDASILQYQLAQNFPNPFNPETKIQFSIPVSGRVQLRICDVLGREVALLLNEERDAGIHSFMWDGSFLASGIYFCTLHAGSFVDTKKLVLAK
ncbi:MAG: FG-GAP-like repeat-containing protein [Bacteroidota bacterium]